MFALPHHLQSFDATTNQQKSSIQLQTTTKGLATAILSDSWVMNEPDLPVSMGFAPWNPVSKNEPNYSASAIQIIANAAASEVSQDISGQTNLDSMYFSGKVCHLYVLRSY
jgi:endo-1,3(4)-beta-glucanase